MSSPRPRTGRVYQLRIVPPEQTSLWETWEEHIRERLSAGKRVTRYNREWIVGPVEEDNGLLSGRIGFRGADSVAEVWDDDAQDFKPSAHPTGLTAPYAIRLRDLRMAVQPRGADMELNGIIGALRSLLSEEVYRWNIVPVRTPISFEQWRASVTKVISARMVVRRPNPHYRDTPDLESLMEQARAETVSIEARNAEDGIDLDSDFLVQTREHMDASYGEARYEGQRGNGDNAERTHYSTRYGSEDDSDVLDADPETGEVLQAELREALAQQPVEDDTQADEGADQS